MCTPLRHSAGHHVDIRGGVVLGGSEGLRYV
jgi:hypothetical protein